jgi:crossover junction endodeoxyribonuclease RusA
VMLVELTRSTIEFAQPALALNMNQRLHWREERRRARRWRSAAATAARDQIGHQVGPAVVHITLPVFRNLRRDPHNYFPTVKPIVDGLVDAGLWPDDTPQWVTTIEPTLAPYNHSADLALPPVRVTITPRPVPR